MALGHERSGVGVVGDEVAATTWSILSWQLKTIEERLCCLPLHLRT